MISKGPGVIFGFMNFDNLELTSAFLLCLGRPHHIEF